MKTLHSNVYNGSILTSIYTSDSDQAIMVNVDCASTVQSGSPTIPKTTYLTIAICKRVDSSNFCVTLPALSPYGSIVEVYADGGSITIFPQSGTFLDGSSSVSTATGARFRSVITQGGNVNWAKID